VALELAADAGCWSADGGMVERVGQPAKSVIKSRLPLPLSSVVSFDLSRGNEYVEKKQKQYINPVDFAVLVSFFSIHFQNRLPPAKCRCSLS
jgi:hypothetical protein